MIKKFVFTALVATVSLQANTVFTKQPIPKNVKLEGHAKGAKTYGYRIPSLLTTKKGTVIAFSERRVGLHDHALNDIVCRRSIDGGKTWGKEIVAVEDGMNSINDPLTVQLADGRIMMMYARFPYGRHARNSGWIKMADTGMGNLKTNIHTYITFSKDDGKTWSKGYDITKFVKPDYVLNANNPGAMIQLQKGKHKGRVITPLWMCIGQEDGGRKWENIVVYSDDLGKTWKRTAAIKNPEKGYPNESQIVEAGNGDLIIIARNQAGAKFRKKSVSKDSGKTWSEFKTDQTMPSVACMGSVIRGPKKADGSWDLYAAFPSNKGRKNGQICISTDHGKTWQVKKVIKGMFAYSAIQLSPDQKSLICIYETNGYKDTDFISIPLSELK